ncbi:MAG TPA: phosphoribosyl-AMP cyclohydrolase [Kofleriaceae bacterium]|nr:phosphoribosyl-AMP cyclohydrolase [Kofleriaceae bacterium]
MTGGPASGLAAAVQWDDRGLAPAVVCHVDTGAVLMLGWMNAEALAATAATGFVHFFSRSRQRLWKKGETSGHTLSVREIRIDCDGDALLVVAAPAGPTCHTGRPSCFFRRAADSAAGDDAGENAGPTGDATRAGEGRAAGDSAHSAGPTDAVIRPGEDRAREAGPAASAASSATLSTAASDAWVEDAGPTGAAVTVLERLHAVLLSRRGAPPARSYTASLLAGGPDAIAAKITEEAGELCAELAAGPGADEDRVAHEAADLLYFVLVGLVGSGVAPAAVWSALEGRFGQSGHAEKASRR